MIGAAMSESWRQSLSTTSVETELNDRSIPMELFGSRQVDGIAAKISLGANEGYRLVSGELF